MGLMRVARTAGSQTAMRAVEVMRMGTASGFDAVAAGEAARPEGLTPDGGAGMLGEKLRGWRCVPTAQEGPFCKHLRASWYGGPTVGTTARRARL